MSISMPTIPTRALRAMLLVFVIFYLCFHAVSGDRGMVAWFKANRQLDALQTELAEVREKRELISTHVDLLSGPQIDGDMLDEQARKVLGFAGRNEVVVLEESENARK